MAIIRKWLGALATVVATFSMVFFAGSSSVAAAPSGAPIVIGGTLSLTGPFAESGQQYYLVDKYWVNQINKDGGLLGRPVKLIIYDDQSDPTTCTALYQKLINTDHVNFLLAPYSTYLGAPVLPIALSNHMMLWNYGFVGESLFDQAKGMMITTYNYQDNQYSYGLFQVLNSLPKSERPTKLAVLTDQNPFTLAVLSGVPGDYGSFVQYAKHYGYQIVMNQQYPATTTNFTSLVQQAKLAGADGLVALSLPTDALDIARTVGQLGYKPKVEFFGGSQVTTLPNWSSLGAAADGTLSTTVAMPNEHFNGLSTITALFQKNGVNVLPSYAASAYALFQILQTAVTATHSLNQVTVDKYVLSHQFNTAIGKIRYKKNGTLPFNSLVVQYVNGKNVVVWPAKYATGKFVTPLP